MAEEGREGMCVHVCVCMCVHVCVYVCDRDGDRERERVLGRGKWTRPFTHTHTHTLTHTLTQMACYAGGTRAIPDTEVFETMHMLRRSLVSLLCKQVGEGVPESDRALFAATLQMAYTNCIGKSGTQETDHVWCAMEGDVNRGRFVTSRHPALKDTASKRVPLVKDGVYAVEIDLQTLELRMRGTSLRALDTQIANNEDIQFLFGEQARMIQCTVEGTYEHKKSRYLVGLGYQLDFWDQDQKLRPMYETYDRDYDPNELFQSEEWIAEVFEPVRRAWFCRPTAREDVPFFLPEEEFPADTSVALLVGAHPQHGRNWFEVYVFKTYRMVHAYRVTSHGRRYYRSLVYASDSRLCLRDLQPSVDDRKQPWEVVDTVRGAWQWGRHEAYEQAFADNMANLFPPNHPESCVVQRPLADPTLSDSAEHAEEVQLVESLMAPLSTSLRSVLDAFTDMEDATRRTYAVSKALVDRAGQAYTELDKLIAHTEKHEYFRDLDDEDEDDTGLRGMRAGPAQRAALAQLQAVLRSAHEMLKTVQSVHQAMAEKEAKEKLGAEAGEELENLDDMGMEAEPEHDEDDEDREGKEMYFESWDDLKPHNHFFYEKETYYLDRLVEEDTNVCCTCDEPIASKAPRWFDMNEGAFDSVNGRAREGGYVCVYACVCLHVCMCVCMCVCQRRG